MKVRGVAGRADLVWALASDAPDLVEATAALLGYAPRGVSARIQGMLPGLTGKFEGFVASKPVPPLIAQAPLVPSACWQAVSYQYLGEATAPEQPLPRADVKWTGRPTERLKTYPLSHWRALQPRLRTHAALPAATRTPDVERAVGLISRGRRLERVPYEQRLRWGPRLQIVLDRSERLVPFWADQDVVGAHLSALLPSHAVEQTLVWDDVKRPRILLRDGGTRSYRVPPPGSLVLVIGDLGCAERGGSELRRRWGSFGAALRGAGCRAAVLTPLPPQRWSKSLSLHWTWIPWERPRALAMAMRYQAMGDSLERSSLPATDSDPMRGDQDGFSAAHAVTESPAQSAAPSTSLERLLAARAQRLLVLVSPAVRIEPGFLRAVRLLLPAGEADAGTEIDLWQHAAITSTSFAGASLDPGSAARLRARFAEEPPALQRQVLALLRAWRGIAPQELWFEEIQSLDPRSRALLPEPQEVELAERFFRQLSQRARGLVPGGVTQAAIAWYWRCERRLPERAWAEGAVGEALQRLSWAVHKDEPDYQPVATFDPGNAPAGVRHRLRLSQVGENLHLDTAHQAEADLPAPSTVGAIETGNGLIRIEVEPSAAQDGDGFWESGQAPPWATNWGWDEYGAWVEYSLQGKDGMPVVQRMRWIAPGSFLMGSPEDEPERWDDEGPRHEVRIADGFWLFDTACTQALWQAAMGENLSRFKGADRPVEYVSWDDAQRFIAELNEQVAGLELGLPSEAQWEFACRAGTQTPFSFGANVTPEQVNYNGDYPYGRAAKGEFRGETVPVGSLPANRWGLYEMQGNVWEWVQDAWHDSYEDAPSDGSAWESGASGADRVIRGGSWLDYARVCRSAYRSRFVPEGGSVLGFRCARVQGGELRQAASGPGAARPAERIRPGGAGADSRSGASDHDSPAQRSAGMSEYGAMDGARASGGSSTAKAERTARFSVASGVDELLSSGAASSESTAGPVLLRMDSAAHAQVQLPDAPAIEVRSDRERLTLQRIHRPKWASAMGRDRFGLWAEITVEPSGGEPVIQRLRWIPPGRFLMGSPADEPGRLEAEGPQHAVTIGSGYWLFDTPCTQALWQAIMSDNPSEFQHPDRPVENVAWGDAQRFRAQLNEWFDSKNGDGGAFAFPSEAQWEYACRAGTQTALYTGPIEILGAANAPALDEIAWYGGNSSVGFELVNGKERTWLSEMQYPQGKAGTHPVKGRKPNAWGLYDMLGNVWEWTQDTWEDGYEGAPADGSAREGTEAGAARVVRGGSWFSIARSCRGAYRDRYGPDDRGDYLGFRCARAQVS